MDTGWYVAEIVEEITVQDDPRNVIHQNLVLVRANSPDEAYEKAIKIGEGGETSYDNPSGKTVRIRFRGLSKLEKLEEELEDGAELTFRYKVGVSEEELRSMVRSRERLAVFRPPEQAEGPDYSSREVLAMLERDYGITRLEADPSNKT